MIQENALGETLHPRLNPMVGDKGDVCHPSCPKVEMDVLISEASRRNRCRHSSLVNTMRCTHIP